MFKRELKVLRQLLWMMSEDMTWQQLADRSGLCLGTVRRFLYGETQNPSYRTISSLCRAVGVQIEITNNTLRMSAVAA